MKLDPLLTDYLGDPLPPGYRAWSCEACTAVCNFEAMNQCVGSPCPFDLEKPESNGGHFGFIVPIASNQPIQGEPL